MYREYFQLEHKPFSLAPDPRFMFMASSHREALAHLVYGIEDGHGFIQVVGQVGTGKTTLCRALLEHIGNDAEIAFIFNPSPSEIELLSAINHEFGLPTHARTRSELVQELNQFLLEKNGAGRRVLLVIDEAQNLEPSVLEQIRLLSNLETDRSKLIQIILVGQPELEENLERTDLRQLQQRISVRWKLQPFNAAEVGEYLEHRLAVAGRPSSGIFTPRAVRIIHARSRGIPRLINSIADRALLVAYSQSQPRVTGRIAAAAAAELPASEMSGWRAATGLTASGAAGLLTLGLVAGLLFASFAPNLDRDAGSRRTEAVAARPPGSGELLSRLAKLGPERSSELALAAVLERWGQPPVQEDVSDPSHYAEVLREVSRLRVFATDASLDRLMLLNLPSVLELELEPGQRRWVALVGLSADADATVSVEGQRYVMSPEELERAWTGRSVYLWNNFKSLPALEPQMTGSAVRWVQARLADLGFLRPGDPSGEYDALTVEAVRRFQQSRALEPTGSVGPATLIALYQALEYATPRLTGDGGA